MALTSISAFLEDRSSWEASRDFLAARFEQIPDLDATPLPSEQSEMRDLGWSFVHDDLDVEVWIASGGWGLSVDGSSREGIVLAVWFRSIVPAEVAVRVSDSMYSFDRPLEPGTTVDDLGAWYEENVGELY